MAKFECNLTFIFKPDNLKDRDICVKFMNRYSSNVRIDSNRQIGGSYFGDDTVGVIWRYEVVSSFSTEDEANVARSDYVAYLDNIKKRDYERQSISRKAM